MAPRGTAVSAGPIEPALAFSEAESSAMAHAMPSRRDEFHTGRKRARAALAELKCPPVAIPVGADGVPVWPTGFVGSISHSRALCVVHVGVARDLAGIGIDVEPDEPLGDDVATKICSPGEDHSAMAPLLRFAAKEAFFKAYFPIARTFLEFSDVRVDLQPDGVRFAAEIVAADKPSLAGRRRFEGCAARLAGHVVAALWIAA